LAGLIESRPAAPDRRIGAYDGRPAGAGTSIGGTPGQRLDGRVAIEARGKSG
jgi:hypothetical protein